jgi:hypothetical protein
MKHTVLCVSNDNMQHYSADASAILHKVTVFWRRLELYISGRAYQIGIFLGNTKTTIVGYRGI